MERCAGSQGWRPRAVGQRAAACRTPPTAPMRLQSPAIRQRVFLNRNQNMDNRRTFLQQSAAAASLAAMAGSSSAARKTAAPRKFKLRYGPHFGMFKEHAGPDPIAQLEFMAAQGFTALEDNG